MNHTVQISNFIIYYLFILIIPILLFIKCKYNKNNHSDFLDKNNANVLKGLAVILILLGHLTQRIENCNIICSLFINSGLFGVIIFLFLSGYGIYIQYNKDKNYLTKIFKKIFYLIATFILCDIFVSIVEMIMFQQQYDLLDFFKSFVTLSFCNGRNIWFLVIIIYNYISFYIIEKYLKKDYLLYIAFIPYVIILKFLGFGTWWFNSAIAFPIGIFVAKHNKRIFEFCKKYYIILLVVSIISFILTMYLYQKVNIGIVQYIIPIIIISLIILLCIKFKFNSRAFTFVNKYSFEIYLIQPLIMDLNFYIMPTKNSIIILPILIFSILFSILFNKIIHYVFSVGNKKNLR